MTEASYSVDVRTLDEFTPRELYTMLKMRTDVFVVEQKCPYPELDGSDPETLHLRLLSSGELLACARIGRPSGAADPTVIGRVVVSPNHRGKRLGEVLMKETIAACERLFSGHPIVLSAQSHLQRFYETFGFIAASEEYLEDDIPHIDMKRGLTATTG
ncbi:GNAT family N-acetyltransferase [Mesorhizobium loti]|nr:GNAT family N-acetyltransferase [Mesorhizobium loti]PLP58673.1 GNAT family N-acetyltransferase [Mesorhizobium loti]